MPKLILIVFFTISCALHAQKLELGKVTIAELEEKQHPKDPTAAAAVLFESGEVNFNYTQSDGFSMTLRVKEKIKIYNKEGYEYANAAVQYVINSNYREKVAFSDVATYNLVDGKIIKAKLKSDGEFEEKVNKDWGKRKISLPNVKEGSIIEYEYTITSPRIGRLRDWNFQAAIPVNYSEFKTYIPEYFIYNVNQRGFIFPKVAVEKSNKKINYTYRDGNTPGGTIIHSASQESLEFTETRTTYTAVNMPAMKEEAFVNNIKNYTSGISHELSIIKYPNSSLKTFSSDWETVTKTIYKQDDFGLELAKTGYFESDIDALLRELKTKDEIIKGIFNYVKSNVKWNDDYGYSCDDGVKAAYKNKTGNVAEINLMLTAMLRYAQIDANPVLISTRSNGVALFPNVTAFNYVITAVETENGLVLLDATEKYSLPNILPLRDLNWMGRLIRKDGTSLLVDLIPKNLSKETNYMNVVLKQEGTAEGKIRRQLTDYEAFDFRKKYAGANKDNYIEELENRHNAIEISDYSRDNDFDLLKPISETYTFKSSRDIEIINDKIYFSPLLFLCTKENHFKQEKREYPVDFGYPSEIKYNINIEIPEGYIVESLPKPINLVTGDELGAFKYMIANNGNKIQLTLSSGVNAAIVPADYYDVLKEFYQGVVDKQNEKIVLIKKAN